MNRTSIALAALLAATAAVTSSANAGGGVRLGFGGPLGTFVATPAHGGGAAAYGHAPVKRRTPAAVAARKPDRPEREIAKASPTAEANRNADAPAKVETTAASEDAPRITGSSALIQSAIPSQSGTTTDGTKPLEAAPSNSDKNVKAETAHAADASSTCKKFVPALGTTVSIGCNE